MFSLLLKEIRKGREVSLQYLRVDVTWWLLTVTRLFGDFLLTFLVTILTRVRTFTAVCRMQLYPCVSVDREIQLEVNS